MSKSKGRPVPILLMVRELASGGIERDVTKLAIGLDRAHFTPCIATYKVGGPRYDELKAAGVPILHLPLTSLKSATAILTALQFARFIRRRRIRLVHAFDASGIFGVPLARLMRVPVTLMSTLGDRRLLDARSLKLYNFTDHLVDTLIVNCEAMRRHLTDDFGITPERIELCYNGVDTKQFYPAPAQKPPQIADATLVIGTVCVLRPEKALELFQEAFAKIRHSAPGMKLLIVGNGPELEKLKANGSRLGIEQHSVFMPAVSSVAPIMRSIDVFVSSSSSEAFSNSILEAMACGCCVVASRVGGTPELIEDEERGLLFTSGNADELAQRLLRVAQDAGLRKKLGARAAAFAANELNMDRNIQRNMEIYETLLYRKNALEAPPLP